MFTIVTTLNQSRKTIVPDYYPRCFGLFDTREEARLVLDGIEQDKARYASGAARVTENILRSCVETFEIVEICPFDRLYRSAREVSQYGELLDELEKLRARERLCQKELNSHSCVGVHRDICYKELGKLQRQIKAVWAKLKH